MPNVARRFPMSRRTFIEVELGAVASKQELHDTLARALGLPDWYGRNWDAFWDAITGLVEMPVTLRLSGWSKFETQLPADAQALRGAFAEMAWLHPDLASDVIYA